MKGNLLTISLFLYLGFSSVGSAQQVAGQPVNAKDLPHFHEVVVSAVYRGAQPTDAGFSYLAVNGIKTVIDLRNEKKLIAKEAKLVSGLKMQFVSVPMSGFFAPKDADVQRVQQILNTPAALPVFVHCKYGEDRTGLMIGLYRVFTQHDEPKQAYQEMEEFGFHPELVFLKHYFDEKTGL